MQRKSEEAMFFNLIDFTALMITLRGFSQAVAGIVIFIGNTPLNLTTQNPVVGGLWLTMTVTADAFLGLYVIMKMIQMMYGDATGAIHIPVGKFIAKVILTVLLIHASSFLGTQLLLITNALCALLHTNLVDVVTRLNGGQVTGGQALGISFVLTLTFTLSLIRIIFQAIKRIVFFNVLFVLSGPAFLMSLDMQTAPWFQFWFRTYMTTILTQFFQFLTLVLGFQFYFASKTTGFLGFVLAIAMLNLTAEIPALLSRFATSSGANTAGIGSVVRSAVTAAALFI
jgi:hypothetical protein